jgi:hypothetical protein
VKRRNYLLNLGVDWMIILKWILKKYNVTILSSTGSGQCCEYGNECHDSLKGREFFEKLTYY